MVTHFGTNHALQRVDGLRILCEPQVTAFSILRLVIGASQRQARHTRNVMSSQPETVIVLAARATGFSLNADATAVLEASWDWPYGME